MKCIGVSQGSSRFFYHRLMLFSHYCFKENSDFLLSPHPFCPRKGFNNGSNYRRKVTPKNHVHGQFRRDGNYAWKWIGRFIWSRCLWGGVGCCRCIRNATTAVDPRIRTRSLVWASGRIVFRYSHHDYQPSTVNDDGEYVHQFYIYTYGIRSTWPSRYRSQWTWTRKFADGERGCSFPVGTFPCDSGKCVWYVKGIVNCLSSTHIWPQHRRGLYTRNLSHYFPLVLVGIVCWSAWSLLQDWDFNSTCHHVLLW